ncbi:NAD(P)H-dependent oxidoreductase, partial [Parafrankia colletiae]|uniref:NAD(P)H-dependent oxidoreductase n=1 Tax=Parafrankia colletiae TaxID=573497 RepID=UPI000A94F5B2
MDLALIAEGLLIPWQLSAEAEEAREAAQSAVLVVVATPTYKASFTGLLKLFLHTFAAGSLSK